MRVTRTAIVLALAGPIAGGPSPAVAAQTSEARAKPPRLERPTIMANKITASGERPAAVDGQTYRTLDDYLAKLERDGYVGKAWYKLVKPGLYELVTNLTPPPQKRLFTRAELARKFGFTR